MNGLSGIDKTADNRTFNVAPSPVEKRDGTILRKIGKTMSQSSEGRSEQSRTGHTAYDRVRRDLLVSGLSDWVPLAEVESVITHYERSATTGKVQQFALEVVESLISDGLMQVGDLPFPGEKFKGWDLSVEAAMERLRELFVDHHAEPDLWEFRVWFGLTPAGERSARELEGQTTK